MNALNTGFGSFPGVYVEIILGSPRARCARFGVCETRVISPEEWAAFVPHGPRIVKARAFNGADGWICFAFRRQEMQEVTWAYFFASGKFRVDAAKTLPDAVTKALGLTNAHVLPGYYPCVEHPNGEVWVTMAQNQAIDSAAA